MPSDGEARSLEAIRYPRIGALTLLKQSAAGVLARPARSALTSLGTVLGVAALVATLGLASTAGAQILTRLDRLSSTDVSVEPREGAADVLTWRAPEEMNRLNGVRFASASASLNDSEKTYSVSGLGVRSAESVDVLATTPSTFDAVHAVMEGGRTLNLNDDRKALPVAVLGAGAAERLQISNVALSPQVFVDGKPFSVVGILRDVRRRPEMLGAVLVTPGTAKTYLRLPAPDFLQIETSLGANELIRDQAPTLLSPANPAALVASSPPPPKEVRASVSSDVQALLLVLGAVSLIVGALGIANVTLVSVLERTAEIGVRRALGALQRHIAIQFLTESTVLGFLGGTVGSAVGVLVIVGTSLAKSWQPEIRPWTVVAAPVIGAVVGLLAGVYPAWKAARIEPAEAIRIGM